MVKLMKYLETEAGGMEKWKRNFFCKCTSRKCMAAATLLKKLNG